MIGAIWNFQIQADTAANIVQMGEERLKPLLQRSPGLKEFITLTDPASHTRMMVIVLWESEETSAALRNSPEFQQIFSEMGRVFTSPPTREALEVASYF
jgi:heme-degrading monooxygenase HmoA